MPQGGRSTLSEMGSRGDCLHFFHARSPRCTNWPQPLFGPHCHNGKHLSGSEKPCPLVTANAIQSWRGGTLPKIKNTCAVHCSGTHTNGEWPTRVHIPPATERLQSSTMVECLDLVTAQLWQLKATFEQTESRPHIKMWLVQPGQKSVSKPVELIVPTSISCSLRNGCCPAMQILI